MEAPAKANMYANGRIYRIVCGDLTYVGSTCQPLSKRMANHREGYNSWMKDPIKYGYTTSYRLFEVGVPEIFLIEECSCETKEQLLARERHYIETIKCVNKCVPGRTYAEWLADNPEHKREYYRENIEKIREYRQENASAIAALWNKWYEKNRDKVLVRKAEYRKNNKETTQSYQLEYNKTKMKCACGSTLSMGGKARHERTEKHTNFITASSSPSSHHQ